MSERPMDEVKQEAKELGITFKGNIAKADLEAKIEEYYKKDSEANTAPIETSEEIEEEKPKGSNSRKEALAVIAKQIAEAKKTKIVKITMVDKREASTATDAYFGNGSLGTKVPLDVFVELPIALIVQAENAKAVGSQVIGGKTITKTSKKYVLEYKDEQ